MTTSRVFRIFRKSFEDVNGVTVWFFMRRIGPAKPADVGGTFLYSLVLFSKEGSERSCEGASESGVDYLD